MSENQPKPAQLLLERILGGLQAQMTILDGLPETYENAQMAVINEQLQDEIIQIDAGQIPESIREVYEALQGHGKGTECTRTTTAPAQIASDAKSNARLTRYRSKSFMSMPRTRWPAPRWLPQGWL